MQLDIILVCSSDTGFRRLMMMTTTIIMTIVVRETRISTPTPDPMIILRGSRSGD